MTMRAMWNGAVLAEGDDTMAVEGVHYPVASLSEEYFLAGDHRSVCSWKRDASYRSVSVGGA